MACALPPALLVAAASRAAVNSLFVESPSLRPTFRFLVCIRVYAYTRACVRACLHVYVCMRVRACVHACVCGCGISYDAEAGSGGLVGELQQLSFVGLLPQHDDQVLRYSLAAGGGPGRRGGGDW